MAHRPSGLWPAFLLVFLAGQTLLGCQAGYYWHLVRGQSRIVFGAQAIDQLLLDSNLAPQRRQKLETVLRLRRFAQNHLALGPSSNYTDFYDNGGRPVSWNVTACPPDTFAPYLWDFPVVGRLPYKGFFEEERADAEKKRLEALGFEAVKGRVSAYSTLGFFSDPVFDTMLAYSEARLADLLFHELTHEAIYVEDQTDFNESLATFIGRTGSLEWLAAEYGDDSPLIEKTKALRRDGARFRRFMVGLTAQLDSLYTSEPSKERLLAQRQVLFEAGKKRYRADRDAYETNRYDGFLTWQINNAQLLSYKRYNRNLDLFERVYQQKDKNWGKTIEVFSACAQTATPWVCLEDSLSSAAGL